MDFPGAAAQHFEVLLASINIMETCITESRLGIDKPDLIIRPPLGEFRFLEFGRAEDIIAIGYECAREQLKFVEMRKNANSQRIRMGVTRK